VLTAATDTARGSAAVSNQAPTVQPARTPQEIDNLDENLAAYERRILLRALNEAGGVKKRAAEILGINYRSFRHRLQKYGLGGWSAEPSLTAPEEKQGAPAQK